MLAKVHWRGIDDLLCCSLPLSRTRRPTLHFAGTGPTTRSLNDYAVQEVAIESKRVPVQRRFSAPRICTTAEARSAAITQSTRTGNPTGRGDSVRRQIPQRHLRRDRRRVGPKGSADSRLVSSASTGPRGTTLSFQPALGAGRQRPNSPSRQRRLRLLWGVSRLENAGIEHYPLFIPFDRPNLRRAHSRWNEASTCPSRSDAPHSRYEFLLGWVRASFSEAFKQVKNLEQPLWAWCLANM